MAKLQRRSLSNRVVDRLSVEGKDVIYWDRDLPGFGVRVYRSGARVYLVQGRGPGGSKRIAVGRHGVISADEARRRGAMLLTRIKAGEELEPRSGTAAGPTVGELAERYLREHVAVRCKPNTARGYRRVIAKYILPTLGKLPAAALGREHVADLHHRLRMTPVTANEAVGALSRIFNQAEAWGLVPAGGNPCRFVTKYRSRRLERFLTEEEFRRLGRVLDELEAEERLPVYAAAALRLLMLTGCRCSEIMTLRWEDVHLEVSEIRLRDSKTGPRVVPLSPAAARVLAGLPHAADNPWVIAGRKPGTPAVAHRLPLVSRAGAAPTLKTSGSTTSDTPSPARALALGESLPMIGKLLGHSKIQTTARYAHLARDSVHESAARVAASIGADIRPESSAKGIDATAPP